MTIFAYLALFGWIPAVVVMFAMLPRQLAATIAVIGAWLLLPPYTLQISSLPDYSKNTAATVGMMLGTLIFSPSCLQTFRFRWFDLPMLIFCFTGIPSSLQNGLGLYDGLSDVLNVTLMWGLPYFLGRVHFGDPESLRYFTTAMVVGALFYVPLCLYETRMMTSLLISIYGLGNWGLATGTRLGGYRPNVFFWTGLELGMWMTAASLSGWWLWRCGVLKKIREIPFGSVLMPTLLVTTVLCRSTGALALLAAGMMLLWLSARFQTRLFMAGLLLVGPVYVTVRTANLWSGQQAVDLVRAIVEPQRAESLQYRFMCERLILAHVMTQPYFGWGGWGRSNVCFNPDAPLKERASVPTDGLWIIYLGSKGMIGLISLFLAIALPAIRFVRQFPARLWEDPRLAAVSLSAALLGLHIVDCLLNAFPNIIYLTIAGGLMGVEPRQLQAIAARRGRKATDQTGLTAAAGMAQITLADRNRSLGRTLISEGRIKEAEAAWRYTLDLLTTLKATYRDHPDLQHRWCECANDLAWLLANTPDLGVRDPKGSVKLAAEAAEAEPKSSTYWNTLGAAHYRAGNFQAAVIALDHAVALGKGGTPFDHIFLAMVHARLGNAEDARRWLAMALLGMERYGPSHAELRRFCDEAEALLPAAGAAVH